MTDNIFQKSFMPPQEMITKSFTLFPTNNDYYESDYVAVMNNASLLHIWSQSSWPEKTFTAKENKADLAHHIEDNINHTAYGYMIYSLDKKKCYGSVYVNPILPVADNYHVTEKEIELIQKTHARIDYWVIENGLEDHDQNIEREITIDLRKWFRDTWKIKVYFSARKEMHKRLSIYRDLNYECALNLKSNSSDMTLLLF